jgi:hypothetical protein
MIKRLDIVGEELASSSGMLGGLSHRSEEGRYLTVKKLRGDIATEMPRPTPHDESQAVEIDKLRVSGETDFPHYPASL